MVAENSHTGLHFRLSHLFACVTWIGIWMATVSLLPVSALTGLCLAILMVALVNDRRLTNTSRLIVVTPILAYLTYLMWSTLPKIHEP